MVNTAIDIVAVVSCVAALVSLGWRAHRPFPVVATPPKPRLLTHPWTLFLVTSALALANQVAFSAFLIAAHHADAGFITQYTGSYYFHVDPDFPGVRTLVAMLGPAGADRWLAPSLLRVNAFLELPFALFAYLAIARLFDPAAARLIMRSPLVWLGTVSFSVILSFIEVLLWNPWTVQDLVLRGISCAFFAVALWLLGRRERGTPCFPASQPQARGLVSLLIAFAGAAAIAGVVLVLYDVTLLYNLVHLRGYWGALVAGLVMATAAFPLVGRVDGWMEKISSRAPRSRCVEAATSVAASLSVLFFVPSLAIRYGLSHPAGRACGIAVLAIAIVYGLGRAAGALGVERPRWLVGLGAGLLTGSICLAAAQPALGAIAFKEAALVFYAIVFVGPTLVAWRLVELWPRRG
jgi:hypothetical protein